MAEITLLLISNIFITPNTWAYSSHCVPLALYSWLQIFPTTLTHVLARRILPHTQSVAYCIVSWSLLSSVGSKSDLFQRWQRFICSLNWIIDGVLQPALLLFISSTLCIENNLYVNIINTWNNCRFIHYLKTYS